MQEPFAMHFAKGSFLFRQNLILLEFFYYFFKIGQKIKKITIIYVETKMAF